MDPDDSAIARTLSCQIPGFRESGDVVGAADERRSIYFPRELRRTCRDRFLAGSFFIRAVTVGKHQHGLAVVWKRSQSSTDLSC